jgi:hypothetical protein
MKKNFFQYMDWALLREQKKDLFLLSITEHLLSPKQYEALDGILNVIDAVQDYAVNVEGISEQEVFNLKTEEV